VYQLISLPCIHPAAREVCVLLEGRFEIRETYFHIDEITLPTRFQISKICATESDVVVSGSRFGDVPHEIGRTRKPPTRVLGLAFRRCPRQNRLPRDIPLPLSIQRQPYLVPLVQVPLIPAPGPRHPPILMPTVRSIMPLKEGLPRLGRSPPHLRQDQHVVVTCGAVMMTDIEHASRKGILGDPHLRLKRQCGRRTSPQITHRHRRFRGMETEMVAYNRARIQRMVAPGRRGVVGPTALITPAGLQGAVIALVQQIEIARDPRLSLLR